MGFLNGKKTYLAGLASIAWGMARIALLGDVAGGVQSIVEGCGAIGLRHAVSKHGPPLARRP